MLWCVGDCVGFPLMGLLPDIAAAAIVGFISSVASIHFVLASPAPPHKKGYLPSKESTNFPCRLCFPFLLIDPFLFIDDLSKRALPHC